MFVKQPKKPVWLLPVQNVADVMKKFANRHNFHD